MAGSSKDISDNIDKAIDGDTLDASELPDYYSRQAGPFAKYVPLLRDNVNDAAQTVRNAVDDNSPEWDIEHNKLDPAGDPRIAMQAAYARQAASPFGSIINGVGSTGVGAPDLTGAAGIQYRALHGNTTAATRYGNADVSGESDEAAENIGAGTSSPDSAPGGNTPKVNGASTTTPPNEHDTYLRQMEQAGVNAGGGNKTVRDLLQTNPALRQYLQKLGKFGVRNVQEGDE